VTQSPNSIKINPADQLADLAALRHRRCTGPLQELQGSRSSVWTDTRQVSIRRERPNWRNITVRRRDDADDALRNDRTEIDWPEVAYPIIRQRDEARGATVADPEIR
jgi:hypothetical protein